MCDPVSIAMGVGAVTTMAGQFVQGQAAYTNAKYQQAEAKTNEALAHQQAADSVDLTQKEAAQRYRQESQTEGQQQAAMAANGVDINFGSAARTLEDTRMIGREDVANIYKSGQQRTMGYLYDAYNYRLQGAAAKSAAKGAKIATGLSMLGTALGSASQIGQSRASQNFGGG